MEPLLSRVIIVVGLLSCFERCMGQLFQWKFANNLVVTTLEQCKSYEIIVQNRTSNATAIGVPPYYLLAFTPSGITTRSSIGSNPNNLTWQVNQPKGTSMLLGVIDSNNTAGGMPPVLYSVGDGSSSCLPSPPSTNITVVANITTELKTCQQLGLRVYGGQKPYTISLAAVNSPVITNVTLGPTDDVFTYIDRADPNGQILAAVSDANGTWGTSTPLFNTVGNTNVECVGLISTSGNSSAVDQHPPPPKSGPPVGVIAGVTVAVVVILVIAGILTFLYRRKRNQDRELEPEPAILPEAWAPPPMRLGPDGRPLTADTNSGRSLKEALSFTRESYNTSSPLISGQRMSSPPSSSTSNPSNPPDTPTPHVPPPLILMNSSSDSALRSPVLASPQSSGHSGKTAGGRPRMRGEASSGANRLPPGIPANWQVEPDIIIQHRDGGVVQEIPPPYMDRTGGGPNPQPSDSGNGPDASSTASGPS